MVILPQDQSMALSTLLSLRRFSQLPETQQMREWLRQELSRLDAANRREISDVSYRQRQGACQVLDSLFKLAEEADGKIAQMRDNERKRT